MPGQCQLAVEVRHLDVVEVVQRGVLARAREHHHGQPPRDDLELLGGHRPGEHGEAVDAAGDLGHQALGAFGERGRDEQRVAVAAGRALHAADYLVGVEHQLGVAVVRRRGSSASGSA